MAVEPCCSLQHRHCPTSRLRARSYRLPMVARCSGDELGECMVRNRRQGDPKGSESYEFLHTVSPLCLPLDASLCVLPLFRRLANSAARCSFLCPASFDTDLTRIKCFSTDCSWSSQFCAVRASQAAKYR